MKKILSILLAAVMLLSFVTVSADYSVWNELAEYGRFDGNANIKLDMTIDGEGELFDLIGISSAFGSVFSYDLNAVTNADQTAVQADGKMSIASNNEQIIPSGSVDIWMDMNAESPEAFKFLVILKAADGIFTQAFGDKYVVFDYAKIPGMSDMFNALIQLQKEHAADLEKIAEDFANRPEIKKIIDAVYALLDEIEPQITDDGYSIVLTEDQLKNLYIGLFRALADGLDELAEGESYAEKIDEAFNEIAELLEKIHIFDRDRAFVINLSNNGRNMSGEINLDFDVNDLAAAITGTPSDNAAYNGQCKLSFKMNGVITPLSGDYTITFPELTDDNSVNAFDGVAASIGYIPEENDFTPYGDITIEYNGIPRSFENSPLVRADRTFLPLREMANMFGISDADISYDEATERVGISSDGIEIVMYIGSCDVSVNGRTQTLETPVFTYNDRTYIPVRLVSEMFGKNVDYSEENSCLTVTIND
ncbi:MAG: copper amine oxidase N-terminal domain-containing protein [Clostridia bacterium]|nr:copper amine oxidase N-terminal domain-containing protein [Clostridia bacterium]